MDFKIILILLLILLIISYNLFLTYLPSYPSSFKTTLPLSYYFSFNSCIFFILFYIMSRMCCPTKACFVYDSPALLVTILLLFEDSMSKVSLWKESI